MHLAISLSACLKPSLSLSLSPSLCLPSTNSLYVYLTRSLSLCLFALLFTLDCLQVVVLEGQTIYRSQDGVFAINNISFPFINGSSVGVTGVAKLLVRAVEKPLTGQYR